MKKQKWLILILLALFAPPMIDQADATETPRIVNRDGSSAHPWGGDEYGPGTHTDQGSSWTQPLEYDHIISTYGSFSALVDMTRVYWYIVTDYVYSSYNPVTVSSAPAVSRLQIEQAESLVSSPVSSTRSGRSTRAGSYRKAGR